MDQPVVVEYDPRWPEHFQTLHDFIWPAVQICSLRIDHVGSTAVPGLAAKPIIDLDVVVPHKADMPFAAKALAKLGYENLGDLGLPGRIAFELDPGLVNDFPAHHLYVVVNGNGPHANHIALRDHLRTNAEDRERYGAHKLAIQHLYLESREAYTFAKDEVIHPILRRLGVDFQTVDPS